MSRDLFKTFAQHLYQDVREAFTPASIAVILLAIVLLSTGHYLPVMAVMSGSMEPNLYRGDLMLVNILDNTFDNGEVIVFTIQSRPYPIVHRIISQNIVDGKIRYKTKGDANSADDTQLYNPEQPYVASKDIIGTVVLSIPYLAYPILWIQEFLWIKILLFTIAIFGGTIHAFGLQLLSLVRANFKRFLAQEESTAQKGRDQTKKDK